MGDRSRALFGEFLGTALLLTMVVGSGIMAERLAAGNTAVALLANAIATGCGLFVLIMIFAPISGAHFNPAVSLVAVWQRHLTWVELPLRITAQICGAVLGVWLAHGMFDLAVLQVGIKLRTGSGQWLAEAVATFGLVLLIQALADQGRATVAAAVGLYITSAYWFTASTSFANPAVTLARAMTETFAGIRPADAPGFILAQLAGAAAGALVARLLFTSRALAAAPSDA